MANDSGDPRTGSGQDTASPMISQRFSEEGIAAIREIVREELRLARNSDSVEVSRPSNPAWQFAISVKCYGVDALGTIKDIMSEAEGEYPRVIPAIPAEKKTKAKED